MDGFSEADVVIRSNSILDDPTSFLLHRATILGGSHPEFAFSHITQLPNSKRGHFDHLESEGNVGIDFTAVKNIKK